ncbi:DUF4160 domain-containing protein [Turneriella parva]|uniref:DUF4160 domain-containing protein n=1 Tax=Turneriella parva TaxID=29510 RepID=UPI001C267F83|nr:DUF4160 domain-containing protein [Turneriella parva]
MNLRSSDVPRVSYFLGISIYMYWRDHAPAHFHAIYNDYAGEVVIETGELLAGKLPPRVLRLVNEWREEHLPELNENWLRAQTEKEFLNIKGLE